MPQLTKTRAKLLRTVGGHTHATDSDHFDQLPTPPATASARSSTFQNAAKSRREDVDIDADPLSSDEEELQGMKQDVVQIPPKGKAFAQPRTADIGTSQLQPPCFKHPAHTTTSPASIDSKRSSAGGRPSGDDADDALFSSQGSFSKRRKKSTYGVNIHAAPSYGKQSQRRAQRAQDEKKKGFNDPRKKTRELDSAAKPKLKGFVQPRAKDLFIFGGEETQMAWRASAGNGHVSILRDADSLSELSSPPSSPDVEEVQALNLRAPEPYVPLVECPICGEQVSKFLREDFEDQFTPGKQLGFKWQQRFCVYHKKHNGKRIWEEQGYPEIAWEGLEKRMRRHHSHLLAVTGGTRTSYYRDQLNERLKEGSRTTLQVANSEDAKRSVLVGYYGPRGEKVMTDHIVAHLSDPLRKQAAKDKLVAAAGVSGGVSGFVQTVLVPELAQRLVMEDMRVSEDRSREIIAESGELGDLLNPEAEEKVVESADVFE